MLENSLDNYKVMKQKRLIFFSWVDERQQKGERKLRADLKGCKQNRKH